MSEALSAVTLELDKVAPFLIKLFEIVSSAASDDLVCWSEHGETFRIVDRTKFAQVGPLPVGARGCTARECEPTDARRTNTPTDKRL